MFVYKDRFMFVRLPQFKADINAVMQELALFLQVYLDDAGQKMVDRINEAAEVAVTHLPSEWADNFNASLQFEVRSISRDFYKLVVGSDYTDDYEDPIFMQAMVMEKGTRGVWAGPAGRPVWGSDRLTSNKHPSGAKTHRPLPWFDHSATDFFGDFVRNEEKMFFAGLKQEIESFLYSGVLWRHFIPY